MKYKNWLKPIIITAFILMTIICTPLKVVAINLFFIKKLPNEYHDYKTLDQIAGFGDFSVTKFKRKYIVTPRKFYEVSERHIEFFKVNKNELIIKTLQSYRLKENDLELDQFTYHKLNQDAKIIDTCNYYILRPSSDGKKSGHEVLINNQLVNAESSYYTTWPTDGNKTKQDFIILNKDLKWSEKKVQEHYNFIKTNCKYAKDTYKTVILRIQDILISLPIFTTITGTRFMAYLTQI